MRESYNFNLTAIWASTEKAHLTTPEDHLLAYKENFLRNKSTSKMPSDPKPKTEDWLMSYPSSKLESEKLMN